MSARVTIETLSDDFLKAETKALQAYLKDTDFKLYVAGIGKACVSEEEKQKGHDLVDRISGAITLYVILEHAKGFVVEAGRHPDADG